MFTPLNPEEFGITKKSIIRRIVIHAEADVWKDNFKPPCQYYYIDSFGNHVYIRTRDRSKAQEVADEINGKGFFTVRHVIKATVS